MHRMDHHHEETTSFEVTVTSDDVSNSEITSNAPIVLGTNNTLSWGINECSSSFQSVSSCETLESYEHHALNTESPKVIVVPFLADSATNNDIAGTVVTNNGVHIPVIKECSIRIDQLKMSSQSHFGDPSDEANIEKIIELPFNSNCATDRSYKTQSYSSDEDSSEFFGFGSESVLGNTYFERYRTQKSIKDNKNKIAERINRIVSVKRPRQIHRKIPKAQQPSDNQIEPINQSRIESTEINSPVNKLNNTNNSNNINNTMKPIPMPIPIPMLIPDRVSSTPSENLDKVEANRKVASSDSSDSDSDVTPAVVEISTNNKKPESPDIRNSSKRKEIRKMEKMKRRKELSVIAEKIRNNWRETFAAERRKQRKKERKMRMEKNKYKTYYTKNDIIQYQYRGERKKKRVSHSSDSDSSDTSNTSKTSYTTSSSDSSTDSETTTSYTSQTSHITDSDSTDSNSSDVRSRNRHHFNRRRISPPSTSDSSETSSSSSGDDKYHKRLRSPKKSYRKQSKTKSKDNGRRSPKRKTSVTYRPEEPHQKKRRLSYVSDSSQNDSKRAKNRTYLSPKPQSFKKLDSSSRSPSSKSRNKRSDFMERVHIESTSAGAFSVKQCCFD